MFFSFKKNKFKAGLSLVEVVIASAIILLLSLTLISANLAYLKTSKTNQKVIKATYLIEEGIEAVNFIKNNNWNDLGTVGTSYYLNWNGLTWLPTTTKSLISGTYERRFFTEDVNRDSSGDIVTEGGVVDPNTRKLTVEVVWTDISTTTKAISRYLIKNND